jgi:hypothetical protein
MAAMILTLPHLGTVLIELAKNLLRNPGKTDFFRPKAFNIGIPI